MLLTETNKETNRQTNTTENMICLADIIRQYLLHARGENSIFPLHLQNSTMPLDIKDVGGYIDVKPGAVLNMIFV